MTTFINILLFTRKFDILIIKNNNFTCYFFTSDSIYYSLVFLVHKTDKKWNVEKNGKILRKYETNDRNSSYLCVNSHTTLKRAV